MYRSFGKRSLDFCLSLTALVILSPLLLLLTVIGTIVMKGSPFFTQERPGLYEKTFRVFKFKSMTDKCDATGRLLPDRQRLTKFGRFLRASSLDELPQFFNVLIGDMALIGPRPLLARYLPYYTKREHLRHSVRPGITGWAQVNGRNALGWDSKLELDAYYAEHVSFLFDLKILLLTARKVIAREGVIADKKENYLDVERGHRFSL